MVEKEIKQADYNKISCKSCGVRFPADLAAFDLGRGFAEGIQAGKESRKELWSPLIRLDLKFYYTVRDLCQELSFHMKNDTAPQKLTLQVKDIKRQIEYLLDGLPFETIQKISRQDVLYNRLYEAVRSDYGTPDEVMAEIEKLIQTLSKWQDSGPVVSVPVRIRLNKDINGNELPDRLWNYMAGQKKQEAPRVCPFCGAQLDWLAGYRPEIIIGLAGLPGVGKTAFIASLVYQLKLLEENGFISVKKNASESVTEFEKTIVSEYEKGNAIRKTEIENTEAIPLVYLPLQIGEQEYNFVFVDMPGEVYSGSDSEGLDFISNKRAVLKNADMVWCFIEPGMIDSRCRNANIEPKKEDADRQLYGIISILNVVYDEKKPACIIVTQSDLIDKEDPQYGLYRPETNVIEEYLLEDYSLDLTKTSGFAEKTRAFVDQMPNFRLSLEGVVEGFSMFSAASYGFDVSSPAILADHKIHPSMVELPFLWTLAKLGIIKATKVSMEKNFMGLGREKVKCEPVKDPNEFYMKQ